jgi:hypothetical protein
MEKEQIIYYLRMAQEELDENPVEVRDRYEFLHEI